MGCFNIFYILKQVLYGLRGCLKYIFYSILLLFFIALCLLLFEKGVFAYEGSAFTEQDLEMLDSIRNTELQTYDYDSYTYTLWYDGYSGIYMNLFNEGDYKLYYDGNGHLRSTVNFTGRWYRIEGERVVASGTFTNGFNSYDSRDVGTKNGEYFYYGNLPMYASNLTDILWSPPSVPVFSAPYLNNTSNELSNGQFTYFVVEPGSIPKTSDIIFDVYNTTYSDSADNIVKRYILNQSSPFIIESETYDSGYAYYITARFQDWYQVINGNSYKIKLSWVNPDNPLIVDTAQYTWTMSLTAEQQAIEEQKTQDEIKTEAQETNDFLKDDSYNKSEISANMPNSDSYTIPTNEGFNNIFTSFINAFTTDQTTTVRFYIPFTNGSYIDIPSDLTISKIPAPLLLIIQTFYWFMICRYIVKDIASYAEKAKSGDIITGSTDTNIKTEIL